MQAASVSSDRRALYERDAIEMEVVDALENIFNNNLESRAPHSKFAAIYERLRANEALWADYEPGKEYRPIARLKISRSKQYRKGAEGYYYILRSKCEGARNNFWIVALQSYIESTWQHGLCYVYPSNCTQKTLATCFFYAMYVKEDSRYVVIEVGEIGNYNNYVTIKLQ